MAALSLLALPPRRRSQHLLRRPPPRSLCKRLRLRRRARARAAAAAAAAEAVRVAAASVVAALATFTDAKRFFCVCDSQARAAVRAVYAVAQSAVTSARRAHARAVFFSVFSLARAAEFAKLACTAAQTVAAAAAVAKASRTRLCRSRFSARAPTRAASHAPLQPVMPPGSALEPRVEGLEARPLPELDWDEELQELQLTPRALPQPSSLDDGGDDFTVVVRR